MTKEELGTLIISSQESLYRIAKSLLRSDADCADAIQEAIVKSFEGLPQLKNDEFAKTWLVRILLNECYKTLRKSKTVVSFEAVAEKNYCPSYETRDYSDLYTALSKLPDNMRAAVSLYYAEGFSVREIALIEETTESAVKNRLFKARAKLKDILEEKEVVNI